jgi:phosphopantothenoylcysteine decarboxylase/phosphopantothenate--cysteine ligase
MANVVLGVCSSISIYKACEIIRGFQNDKVDVQVVMTKNAAQLISPKLFSALSGNEAFVDLYDDPSAAGKIAHITFARGASLLLVAPATANIIAKFAAGIADDLISTIYLAVDCPVLIAPAMNEKMYLHPQTQINIRKLESQGIEFIATGKGYLACGDEGWGRLAPPDDILAQSRRMLGRNLDMKGKTIVVTAGPTREYLDPVRFLTSRSSGKMGFALAHEARNRGAEVILISGPTSSLPPDVSDLIKVESAAEMENAVLKHLPRADILVMAAAVSDFRFDQIQKEKIKKGNFSGTAKLRETVDILKKAGGDKGKTLLVGFAAETDHVESYAREKMAAKNLDLIVANNVAEQGIGFDHDENQVTIIHRDGTSVKTEKLSKKEISRIIFDEITKLFG